jgi:opacity protein-like surface antigen
MRLNSFFIHTILFSFLFTAEYSDFGFEIFSFSGDARTHSLGGSPYEESMSLNNVYSLNNFHKKGKLSFSYAEYYSGILKYFQSSYIIRNHKKSSFGFSFLHKKIDNIPNTQEAWDDVGGIISQDQIDYGSIDYYDDQQISILLIYSFTSKLGDVGLKIKPVYTSVLDYSAFGVSFDIGINKKINNNYGIGILIKNLYSLNYWNTEKIFSRYPTVHISNSLNYKRILLLNEISSSTSFHDSSFNVKLGVETSVTNKLKLRIGYSDEQSFSAGIGFDHSDISYSYSYSPNFHNIILGHNHQFSILLDLSKIKL